MSAAADPVPAPVLPTGSATPADDGFDGFVRTYNEALVGFLARRVGLDDARDAAQETMVRLMRYRAQPADQLKLLMYRIGLNVLNDRGRREQARMASVHVSIDDDYLALASPELTHEHRIAQQQALERVRACILKLPPRCRQVYLLNRMEGMSYPQIAAHCGISVKAVEKHIGKALQNLRGALGHLPGGQGEWP